MSEVGGEVFKAWKTVKRATWVVLTHAPIPSSPRNLEFLKLSGHIVDYLSMVTKIKTGSFNNK